MITLKKYNYIVEAVVTGALLLFFLTMTNPNRLSLGLLVLPILLISVIIYLVVMQLFALLSDKQNYQKKKKTISFAISLAVGFLLMLQSIGQLQAGDVAIITIITSVVIFYTSYFRQ